MISTRQLRPSQNDTTLRGAKIPARLLFALCIGIKARQYPRNKLQYNRRFSCSSTQNPADEAPRFSHSRATASSFTMPMTWNFTIGHSLIFFALNIASWLCRFANVDRESPSLKIAGFVLVVLPCLVTGLYVHFDSLDNTKQRQMSASLLLFALNSGLSFQWSFLEPDGPLELLTRTAHWGYAGIMVAVLLIMCGFGANRETAGSGGNDERVKIDEGLRKHIETLLRGTY